jgi:endonuclease YncB( thermonuclease family)
VDGDTIRYHHERSVSRYQRLEISHPNCDYELDWGDKARDRCWCCWNAGPFSLAASESRDTDKYGRKLRSLMRGGHCIGAVLVNEGLAETRVGHRRDWCH